MELSSVFENVKEKFISLKEKILDFYQENKITAILVAGLSIFVLVLIIVLLCLIPSTKNKKSNYVNPPLKLSHELEIPQGPEMPDNYTISRETLSSWTKEQAEEWFTVPSEKEINALSQTNENMINELLGAAP
ncbi:MAG: hypothetical protein K5866_04990 [Treponema sp.]|nr:hypothetical protein [Treponema sp.]